MNKANEEKQDKKSVNLSVWDKVKLICKDSDQAQERSLHLIDDKQPIMGEVVFVHESGNVNVSALDHSGSRIALTYIPVGEKKDGSIYVSK